MVSDKIDPRGTKLVYSGIKSDHDGKVHIGNRHHNIIFDLATNHNFPTPIRGVQGFVTDNGTFLDRNIALHFAIRHGQIESKESIIGSVLTSEDLW